MQLVSIQYITNQNKIMCCATMVSRRKNNYVLCYRRENLFLSVNVLTVLKY